MLVRKIRDQNVSSVKPKIDEPRLVTRNGTTYEMQTANIGGTAASASSGTQPAAELTPAEDFPEQIPEAPAHNHRAQGSGKVFLKLRVGAKFCRSSTIGK